MQPLKLCPEPHQYLGSVSASNESVILGLSGKLHLTFLYHPELPVDQDLIFHAGPKTSPVILQVVHVPTQEYTSCRGT
jgi:hypothetical protein